MKQEGIGKVRWKNNKGVCEPQALSDLQENTKILLQVKKYIELTLGLIGLVGLVFMLWALPVFIRLVNHLLSSN